jgi:hypothetical protein
VADMRQFEDDVVRWLLKHYQLLNTRTRWMLLDLEEQLFKYELRDRPTLLGDDGPPARRLTGPHCCWRLADGGVAAIQELPSFAATVDGQTPPNDWMRSAISPRHAQTVCPAERAT